MMCFKYEFMSKYSSEQCLSVLRVRWLLPVVVPAIVDFLYIVCFISIGHQQTMCEATEVI